MCDVCTYDIYIYLYSSDDTASAPVVVARTTNFKANFAELEPEDFLILFGIREEISLYSLHKHFFCVLRYLAEVGY